jgi:predicted lipoprotein with Yx(FWY)xxD motif
MRRTALFALPVIIALTLAACGKDNTSTSASSSSGSKATTTQAANASASSGTAAIVKLSSSPFGQILTDAQGNTLYVFMKDTGTTSNCTGPCAQIWPAMAASGTPSGTGIAASDLATTTRPDGTTQLTYFSHPVYHYAADTAAGDTAGEGINGFGGLWYVVNKSGDPVKSASGSTSTTMNTPTTQASSSGYSSGY